MINKRRVLGLSIGRRRTRRWVVAGYWGVVAAMTVVGSRLNYRGFVWTNNVLFAFAVPFLFAGLARFMGGTTPGGLVKDFQGRPTTGSWWGWVGMDLVSNLDERDKRLRNAAHYEAYRLWRIMMIFGLMLVFVLISMRKPIGPLQAMQQPVLASFLRHLSVLVDAAAIPMVYFAFLLFWTLPQNLILWWGPDVDEAGNRDQAPGNR
jgi:hypothetical protein